MKTQFKRFSKSALAVVLTLCMLVSCMTVGIIATDAAKTAEERVGVIDDSESVGASTDYGVNRKFLYINLSGYADKDNMDGIDFYWDVSNGTYSNKAGYVAKSSMTVVAPDVYRVDLSTVNPAYKDLSGIKIGFNSFAYTWDQAFYQRSSDNNNCITLNGGTWSTEFNLWYGSSDTGLNTALFLASGGVNFPLTTSNTFINVVNAAYDSWNSAGSVWSSSSTIDKMIDSDDNIIFKERKDQNSTTYYALIKAKNSAAAKYTHSLTYDKNAGKLTITSTPPASYDIAVDNADDCTILAEYNGNSADNGETLEDVFVDDTVNITVTPNLESKKVTAISVTGAGNAVTGLTNNGDGTYSATLTVAAAGTISATLADKATYTVTLNQASNGTATATVGGVAQESPFTVYEDTSVTFTAEPDEGYAFTGWSGSFTDKTSTVAKTITGTTTVTPTYAVDGYKMLYSSDGTAASVVTTNMIKLPNGHWISASAIDKTNGTYTNKLFTIQRIRDSKYSHSGADSNSWAINNTTHIGARWYDADPTTDMKQFYSNNYIADAYLVYAPEENKLYLTDNDGDHGDVAILAKDGTIRDWSEKTFTSDFGDTHITYVDGTAITGEDDDVVEYNQYSYKTDDSDNNTARAEYVKFKGAAVNKGVTIKVKTTVNETYAALGYYVKGFVVSTEEESYAVIDQEFGDDAPFNELPQASYSSSDVYDKIHGVKSGDEYTTLPYNEFNFTIKGYPTTGIEITPIYYVAEAKSGDNVRFYVEGFEGEVKEKWTNMLAVDVYGESARPFGEYPGQPMLKYNGRYVVDIPRKDIRGITLNNYYWDKVHSYYYGVTTNYQTYDYNDFVYINDMLTAHGKDEDIVFSFRYKRNASHNSQATSNLADRVYYKDSEAIYGSGKTEYDDHTVHADDYRTGYTTMTAAHEAMYDFEPLTDFYGNRVDVFGNLVDTEANATKAAYNPLRIVSNGYDLNKAGRFATAWAFYKPNSWTAADAGTYTLADIVGGQGKTDQSFQSESFLIDPDSEARVRFKYDASIRDDTTLASTKYTDAVGDETILGYWQRKFRAQNNNSTSYPSLVADLAGVPAVITYEYEVGDEMPNKDLNSTVSGNDKNYAYRSDGRWFYSSADELVQAHVIVEYADREGGTFVRDYFQTESHDYTSGENYVPSANTGLATGIKAYFTNNGTEEREGKTFSNTYGYTEANGITDGKYTFDLETVGDEEGNYSFVGWYMLINGEYSFVTKDEELISEATNNDVYVARYVKVPSGNLQITHALTSDSAGDATCYVKAEIYESNGTTLVDNTSYPYTTNAIKIDTKYIKANSNRKVKITLKTVLGSNTTFDQFKEKVGEALNQLTAESTLGLTATVSIDTSGTDMYAYITFPISALFDEDGNQTVKSTPFLSKVNSVAHTKILYSPARYVSNGFDDALDTYGISTVLSAFTRDYYQSGTIDWTSPSYDEADVIGYTTEAQAYMTSGGSNLTELQFNKADTIALNAANSPVGNSSRYSFVGWFVEKGDGSIEKLSESYTTASNSYTIGASDKDLKFIAVFEPILNYVLKYTYDSTHYGSQYYQVTGTFTALEIETYLTWTSSDPSAEGLEGSYSYNNSTKTEFFAGKSPYEKNVGRTFQWEFSNDTTSFYSVNHQLSSMIPSHNGTDTVRKIQFVFPYRVKTTNSGTESQKTGDKVYKVEDDQYREGQYSRYLTINSATYGSPYTVNWEEVNETGDTVTKSTYITAEEKIFDSSENEYHFAYWSLKNIPVSVRTSEPGAEDVITAYDKQVEVARCYNLGFNFTIYQDYIVEPIYVQSTSPIAKTHSNTATIAFTEYGRNQWNASGGGTTVPEAQKIRGDKIFLQFMTSYDREDMLLLNSQTSVKVGILYQRLDELTDAQKESVPSPVDLFNSYGTADPTHGKAAAEAAVASTTNTTVGKSEYAIMKLDTAEKLRKIDNKNRIAVEQAVTHKNNTGAVTGYANYIYRAYAYMVEANGTVTISTQPVYFTFYTVANMADGSSEG